MSTLEGSDPEDNTNFNGVGRGGVRTCGDDAPLRGKNAVHKRFRVTDEGWQKVMPNLIELWDILVFDSFNKRGACGGHRGARPRSMEAGTLSRGGCRGRSGWGGGGQGALWCHCNVSHNHRLL